MGYTRSPFRDFESYLRILPGLDEDDIQLKLRQYSANFITYEISSGIYTFKDFSEVPSRGFKREFEIRGRIQPNINYAKSDSINIECDNITLKTKLIVRYEIRAMKFGGKSFFSTIISFSLFGLVKVMMNISMKYS